MSAVDRDVPRAAGAWSLAFLTALAVGLAGGAGTAPATGNAGSPDRVFGDTTVVSMTNALQFTPSEITIEAGGTVKWSNGSVLVHTVTAIPDSAADAASVELPEGAEPFGSGRLKPDETFAHTFETPGTYRYFCIPHEAAGMVGVVVVEPDG